MALATNKNKPPKSSFLQPTADQLAALYRCVQSRPGFLVRRAYQRATAVFSQACESLGITTTQHGVLTILSIVGEIEQSALARLLYLDKMTLSGVVRLLEKKGLIEREASARDGRGMTLRLSNAGRTLAKDMKAPSHQAQVEFLKPLTKAEAVQFTALLHKLLGM
ncbi:MAG: MarR family transcriptional regulator [Burkholderiales bacterium]|nr:MarR family transcriptional regulator [Burkholderiales bacterium]